MLVLVYPASEHVHDESAVPAMLVPQSAGVGAAVGFGVGFCVGGVGVGLCVGLLVG